MKVVDYDSVSGLLMNAIFNYKNGKEQEAIASICTVLRIIRKSKTVDVYIRSKMFDGKKEFLAILDRKIKMMKKMKMDIRDCKWS